MEQSFKQSEGWVTNLKRKLRSDEFLVARITLTFYYTLTAAVILVISSTLIYNQTLMRLGQSVRRSIPDPMVGKIVFEGAQDTLLNTVIIIDISILVLVAIIGFILSDRTLKPIRENTQKQKRFIADASHELRTPIAVIISGIEVALRNKHIDVTSATEALRRTLDEARELSQLSNQLLDVSTETVQPIREPIYTKDFFGSLGTKVCLLAEDKGISCTLDLTHFTTIQGDRVALERVFFNVISNAITHTPSGGTITLKDSLNKSTYSITIADTGSGIAIDVIQKVFDPFFRGDASRHTEGAGLGLTLAKKIVEEHGGTITLASTVGEGTAVTITLPISS
jgi:signal transduction histidine kinase